MIKILIVDDHALVRMGIRRLLQDFDDMSVIGDAESGEQALKMIKEKAPDVILLDMKMPGMDGWEVTRRLKKSHPKIKVIVVTTVSSGPFPEKVLHLGAMGYLTKGSSAEEIAAAVRKVSNGEKYLSAEIAQFIAMSSLQATKESPFERLSEREMQVLLMITQGIGVGEISEKLFLSSKTVNAHRYRMFEKLAVKNDVELTKLAIKYRLIEDPLREDVYHE